MHDLYRNLLLAVVDDFRIGDGTKRTDAAVEAMERAGVRGGGPSKAEISKSVAHLVDPKIEDVKSDIEKSAAAVRLEMRKRHNELFDKIVVLETALGRERSRTDGNVKDIAALLDGVDSLQSQLGITKPVVEKHVEEIDEIIRLRKALFDDVQDLAERVECLEAVAAAAGGGGEALRPVLDRVEAIVEKPRGFLNGVEIYPSDWSIVKDGYRKHPVVSTSEGIKPGDRFVLVYRQNDETRRDAWIYTERDIWERVDDGGAEVNEAKPKPVGWDVICPDCGDRWTWMGPNRPERVKCRKCSRIIQHFVESTKEWQPLKINCRCGMQYEVPSGTSAEDIPGLCPQCDHGLMNPTFPLVERINVAEQWGRKDLLVGFAEARLIAAFPRGPANVEELRTLEALEHDVIGKIDWKLINKQKQRLVELVRGGTLSEQFREAVRGIVHLIDAMEDWHDAER